jgi:hypothetical protein
MLISMHEILKKIVIHIKSLQQGETLLVSSSPVLRLAEPDPVSTFGYLLRYCISEYVDKDERIEELAFLFLGFAASFMTTYILSHFGILA